MTAIPTEGDVLKMLDSLSNWGRWGADDQLGTVNFITPTQRKRAASVVVEAGDLLRDGIVTRGVLLDVAAQKGRWLDSGEGVLPEDLEAAEKAQGVRVEPGDVLLVRTGYYARRRAEGARNPGKDGTPAVHVAAL